MKDLTKNHIRWLKGFTKDQFDILVKEVIRAYWNIDDVVITDGKGDGGIDIKCYEDKRHNKIPVQITTEQNVYSKLRSDLQKISDAIEKNGYSNQFFFFYSGSPEESKKDELVTYGREEFGIDLNIIDAKFIGTIAENPKYSSIRGVIRELLGDFLDAEKINFSDYEKLRFDLLIYGKETTEIKNNIVRSFLIHELFKNHSFNIDALIEKTIGFFNHSIDKDYCKRQIGWLRTNHKVEAFGVLNNELKLSESEHNRITSIKEELDFQERYFSFQIKEVLVAYGIEAEFENVIKRIIDIYRKNYKQDIEEIKENPESESFESRAIKDILNYFKSELSLKDDAETIVEEILQVCEYNDYIQRIAAGEAFTNISNLPRIEAYLRRQPKPVYLDTPVLLYALCYFYMDNSNFDNNYYKITRDLFKYHSNGVIKIELFTTDQYIRETAFQFLDAFRLIPFTKHDFFHELGDTSSVFYKFFLYLKKYHENEYEEMTFEDFLYDFGVNESYSENPDFLNYLDEFIGDIFENNGIKIVDVYNYQREYPSKRRFEEIKKELEELHSFKGDYRPEITIRNDALMICELFNEDVHKVEPTLLTWDNSFYELRSNYHKKHPRAYFWHLYRPSKFLDQLAVINFQIDSSALTKDILSVLDEDFDIQGKVRRLKDQLSRIINLEKQSGVRLTKELAEIRKREIYTLDTVVEDPEEALARILPIDDVFFKMSAYYRKSDGKYSFDDFVTILNKEESLNQIIDFFKEQSKYVLANRQLNSNLFREMDEIIENHIGDGKIPDES